MRTPTTTSLTQYAGRDIVAAAHRLESLLTACGISVRRGSWLDEAMRVAQAGFEADIVSATDLDEVRRRRALMADVHLLASILGRIKLPTRPGIVRHFALLGKADHAVVSPARRGSRERDLFFELLVAGAASPWAHAVDLDEPDVLMRRGGRTWGVACKAARAAGDQLVKNVRKGRNQVARAGAQRGLIAVRVTDLAGTVHSGRDVPAHLVGPGPTFTSHEEAALRVYEQLDDIVRPEQVVRRATSERTPAVGTVAPIVFVGHLLCDVQDPSGAFRITMLPYWRCVPEEGMLDDEARGLVETLWAGFQPG